MKGRGKQRVIARWRSHHQPAIARWRCHRQPVIARWRSHRQPVIARWRSHRGNLRLSLVGLVVAAAFGLAACGGDAVLRCERGGTYTTATETPRIRTPEDLDNLDALREMPLPEPSPRAEQPDEDGCLEAPPMIIGEG